MRENIRKTAVIGLQNVRQSRVTGKGGVGRHGKGCSYSTAHAAPVPIYVTVSTGVVTSISI